MLFSSLTFLYFFIPAVLLAYFAVPAGFKNAVLFISSLLFYFFGEPVYVLLLIFSSLSDYLHGLYIEKHRGEKKAKYALISSIIINLAMLVFFKYIDFFIGMINSVAGLEIPLLKIPLPIGISFFTFQTMSYSIDVYRGEARAEKNLVSFGTYVSLFPQLVAGPIVRFTDVQAEMNNRKSTVAGVSEGLRRFVLGLAKKVLIANAVGELCAEFRASDERTVLFYWIYAIAFTLQIYFDFSGYSDMAIGLGRVFGFKFPENFNYPYISRSVTEFWRRWHMTLGGWFRDYVYIPLGGNRVSTLKYYRNIFIVWMLTGLWHGAAWNFVLWGLMFAVMLVIEKWFLKKYLDKGKVWPHIYVMLAVIISFVVFNAESMTQLAGDLGGLFGAGGIAFSGKLTVYYLKSYAFQMVIAVFAALPLAKKLIGRINESRTGSRILAVLEPVVLCILLIITTAYLVDASYNPFLYFRF